MKLEVKVEVALGNNKFTYILDNDKYTFKRLITQIASEKEF
jgi:hypothetical protein